MLADSSSMKAPERILAVGFSCNMFIHLTAPYASRPCGENPRLVSSSPLARQADPARLQLEPQHLAARGAPGGAGRCGGANAGSAAVLKRAVSWT